MAYTQVQIVSLALEKLGYNATTEVNTRLEEAANRSYEMNLEGDIASNHYDFATKLAVLTRQTTPSLVGRWNYIFELPGDCIKVVELYPQVDYDIIEDKQLYTNATALTIKYVFKPEARNLPVYYVKYLINEICLDMSESVMENSALAERFQARSAAYRRQAAVINAQSKPNTVWLNSRYVGDRH